MKTILIIDDEVSLLKLLQEKFSKENFSVLGARNGVEGLSVALKKRPDIILLDLIMPKMDGLTMLRKLREDEWGKKAEVIILTNLSDGASIDSAIRAGVYDFLVKSDWKLAELVKKVKEKLKIK